jgi:hypothetical protein
MSKLKLAIAASILVSTIVFFASSYSFAQGSREQAHSLVSPEVYERILDVVFAHDEPKPVQVDYSISLRFVSTKHAESEIVIYSFTNGSVRATFLEVSGESAWNVANDYIQQNGGADAERIAKLIRTTTRPLPASPDRVALWYAGLLRSVRQSTTQLEQQTASLKKTGEATIFLDGSTYELSFQQGLTEVHWTVMDQEVDDMNAAGHAPLARWMNGIRRYSLNHAAGK